MTSEERAAYVNAQAACAIIEALGQLAENEQRKAAGKSPAYGRENEYHVETLPRHLA